jgi:hypothetical protein
MMENSIQSDEQLSMFEVPNSLNEKIILEDIGPGQRQILGNQSSHKMETIRFGERPRKLIEAVLKNEEVCEKNLDMTNKERLILKLFFEKMEYYMMSTEITKDTLDDFKFYITKKRVEERLKKVFKLVVKMMKREVHIPDRANLKLQLVKNKYQKEDVFFFYFFKDFCDQPKNDLPLYRLFKNKKIKKKPKKVTLDADFKQGAISIELLKKIRRNKKFFENKQLKNYINVSTDNLVYQKMNQINKNQPNILLSCKKNIQLKMSNMQKEWTKLYEKNISFAEFKKKISEWFQNKKRKLPWSVANTIFSVEVFKDLVYNEENKFEI